MRNKTCQNKTKKLKNFKKNTQKKQKEKGKKAAETMINHSHQNRSSYSGSSSVSPMKNGS